MPKTASRLARGDPYDLRLRWGMACAKCGAQQAPGEVVFYYPSTKTCLGNKCGHADEARRDFAAHAFDAAQNGAA